MFKYLRVANKHAAHMMGQMDTFLFLTCLIVSQVKGARDVCQGVSIQGTYYRKDLLLKNFGKPRQMIANRNTNDLYFSYGLIVKSNESKTMMLDLNEKKYTKIRSIESGFSHAIDQDSGNTYIGGFGVIYKYKPGYMPTKIVSDLDNWVSDMYFLDGDLYFSTYPDRHMFSYRNGGIRHLTEFDYSSIKYFVINDAHVIFFCNDSGVYSQDAELTVLYRKGLEEDVTGIALDNNGKVYASLFDGLYFFNEDSVSLKKILDVPSAFGVGFDKYNNMLYSTENSLIRLLPIHESECGLIY